MKKASKKIALLLIIVLVFSSISMVAFAGSTSYTVYDTYVTIFSVPTNGAGTNKNIKTSFQNISVYHHNDIRMLDKNGNIVWKEYGAVDYNATRTFWCGSNVYTCKPE